MIDSDNTRTDRTRSTDPVNSSQITLLLPFLARWLLVFLLAAGIYFFHGFLVPILTALVIAVTTWPFYQRLLRFVGGRAIRGATIAILLIIAFFVVPISVFMAYAVDEVALWLSWALDTNAKGAAVPEWVGTIPWVGNWMSVQWVNHIGKPGDLGEMFKAVSGANISNIYYGVIVASGTIIHLVLTAVFMLITLFFIYKDGVPFTRQLDHLGESMFPNRWNQFSRLVPAAISATVMGMGLIAIAEGIILGTAYWIAGVPYPLIMGAITGFMALVPGGAPLCFTLVSVYLVASGSSMAGLCLFIWGSFELFMVDKFIRPKLVGGPIKLPFLPTFFGLVGGVKTMGFLGLFIGPVLMALIVAMWREWLRELGFYSRPVVTKSPSEPV